MSTIHQILIKYWGYPSFRPLQEDIINSVLEGKDTLALLPTGGGKSICYQVPALAKEGVCIVISPLIALMKDQVEGLVKRGINALAIYSGMKQKEIDIAFDNAIYGSVKFIFMSPERLTTEMAQVRIKKMNVGLLAIDEAHCISQWGYDFRPPYLEIAKIRKLIPNTPVLALTATATPEVVIDIQDKLAFETYNAIQKSFERKNLTYVVLYEQDKLNKLLRITQKLKGSAVVYVRNRRKTQEIAYFLSKNNQSADYYHAGITTKERDTKQNNWINDRIRIMVATNAFGMGIDKPNVRFVVHLDLPDSIEAYFQEAGRGGRDEKQAYAILLFNDSDSEDVKQRIKISFPEITEIKRTYLALGNYYKLAVGAGKNETFCFDINDFCKNYELKPIIVFNALKVLEKNGLITSNEAVFQPSKVHFNTSKEILYDYQVRSKYINQFVKLLLRKHGGLFDGFVAISEKSLAIDAKVDVSVIKKALQKLNDHKILIYNKQTDKPTITFLTERLHSNDFYIDKKNYKEQKERQVSRIESMLKYAESNNKCRSQVLLAYFGEKNVRRCGSCDVCLRRNELNISKYKFDLILEELKNLINSNSYTLEELVKNVKTGNDDQVLKVIQWLKDNDKIIETNDMTYKWQKK